MFRKLAAECFGTFWLVFGGCGSAAYWPQASRIRHWFCRRGVGVRSDRLTMAFAVGHISGGHFNPAVTIGLWAGGRFRQKKSLAT